MFYKKVKKLLAKQLAAKKRKQLAMQLHAEKARVAQDS